MPGVAVDLLDVDGVAEVHADPAAVASGGEEKVLVGLVRLGGELAVVELSEAAAVFVRGAVDDGELRLGARIGLRRGGGPLEFERGTGVLGVVMVDDRLDFPV